MKLVKGLFLVAVGIGISQIFPMETMEAVEWVKGLTVEDFKAGVEYTVNGVKSAIDFIAGLFGDKAAA